MSSVKIQNLANCATVFAALVAAGSFYYGYLQFSKTQQDARQVLVLQEQAMVQDRDSNAIDLFVKYNELMIEPRLRGTSESQFWRENLGISIAESIFRLRGDDRGWKETVSWMLENHVAHLKRTGLNCDTYDADFVKLANAATQEDLCKPRTLTSSARQ